MANIFGVILLIIRYVSVDHPVPTKSLFLIVYKSSMIC